MGDKLLNVGKEEINSFTDTTQSYKSMHISYGIRLEVLQQENKEYKREAQQPIMTEKGAKTNVVQGRSDAAK